MDSIHACTHTSIQAYTHVYTHTCGESPEVLWMPMRTPMQSKNWLSKQAPHIKIDMRRWSPVCVKHNS